MFAPDAPIKRLLFITIIPALTARVGGVMPVSATQTFRAEILLRLLLSIFAGLVEIQK
jgi:hypothetical protein